MKVNTNPKIKYEKILRDFTLTQVQIVTSASDKFDSLLVSSDQREESIETYLGLLLERADSFEAVVLSVRKNTLTSEYNIDVMTPRHCLLEDSVMRELVQ